MADVAGGGIVTGSALRGKGRYILFVIKVIIGLIVYLLSIMHVSPTRFGECLAQLIRGIASEGSIGPVAGSAHISIVYKMPGLNLFTYDK